METLLMINQTQKHFYLYIHENLCPRLRSIYEECDKIRRDGDIRKLWTYNGIVNIKKTENSNERPQKISHENDLHTLFPNHYI